MKNITPCLMFDRNAEEAAKYYVSIVKNSKIKLITHYGAGMPLPEGTVLTVLFDLNGQEFMALNAYKTKFSDAVSFMINCDTQKEIDEYWKKLSRGGKKIQCGWLKDKFGVTWQVVPAVFNKWIRDKDPKKKARYMQAMMKMKKLDIKKLEQAFKGK